MKEDSPKWDAIVKVLESEKASILKNILSKQDDDGKELDSKQIYDLITWHSFIDYVVTLPELILGDAAPRQEQKESDNEVYDTPLSDVKQKIMQ